LALGGSMLMKAQSKRHGLMTGPMFPVLAAMDDRIDELQDQIFTNPKEEQLAALFALKRQLVDMRKLVTPQRDMVSAMLAGVVPVPGMTAESERYVRDLYDHLIRISDMVDSYRDLLSGSLDAYMSMVSNRLNAVMKQLTIIATIFLPLSFLTGFFGQNFSWLVNRIGAEASFFGVGVGTELLAVAALLILFKKRGWIGRGELTPALRVERPWRVPRSPRRAPREAGGRGRG
jgi:magnesium transporter